MPFQALFPPSLFPFNALARFQGRFDESYIGNGPRAKFAKPPKDSFLVFGIQPEKLALVSL